MYGVRESIAGRIIEFYHINSEDNYADILTKPLGNAAFHRLVKPLLFRTPICYESIGTNDVAEALC